MAGQGGRGGGAPSPSGHLPGGGQIGEHPLSQGSPPPGPEPQSQLPGSTPINSPPSAGTSPLPPNPEQPVPLWPLAHCLHPELPAPRSVSPGPSATRTRSGRGQALDAPTLRLPTGPPAQHLPPGSEDGAVSWTPAPPSPGPSRAPCLPGPPRWGLSMCHCPEPSPGHRHPPTATCPHAGYASEGGPGSYNILLKLGSIVQQL